jgi:3-methyl-2-oxobutanoate hydroxymethyltransferase
MKITIESLAARKKRGPKIVMLTSYDFPTALLEDELVDIQLVGDSVGTNILGYPDVSHVSIADMVHHTAAVARGASRSFVLCDMPFRSFETPAQALETARRLIDAGADGVKMEGETVHRQIEAVAGAGIPVCAHIGFTPQTKSKATVQGKDLARAKELLQTAVSIEQAGAALMVLELIPERLAGRITELLGIATIGIGAGRLCDGQVQVVLDILGLSERIFRHAKAYQSLKGAMGDGIAAYAAAVRDQSFPADANVSRLDDEVYDQIVAFMKDRYGIV